MVQWPGRRGKLLKWRTPVGKVVNTAVSGSILLLLWNALPLALYTFRKKRYNEEFLQGKRERRFEDLEGFELHCAFWGWSYKNIPQTQIDLETFTIRELKVEDGEPVKVLHQLPPSQQRKKDFEKRQAKIEELRNQIQRESYNPTPILGSRFIFPANAIFEA